ncbi:MAG TPA: hypothetical protein VI033_08045 [Candidatus Nitrosopolaris sp.]
MPEFKGKVTIASSGEFLAFNTLILDPDSISIHLGITAEGGSDKITLGMLYNHILPFKN